MEGFDSKLERLPEVSYKPPAVESFFNAEAAKTTWPEVITNNSEFKEQTEKQRLLLTAYQTVISTLPLGMSVEKGVEAGLIVADTLDKLYEQLTEYLQADPSRARLVLYFPFELLSDPRETDSSRAFIEAYRAAWESQLSVHEVRANFNDGDVLEPELRDGDHPRVVKATHLIPGLVEHGVISVTEAITYAESSNDFLLKDGVLDSLGVLHDKSLLTNSDIVRLRNSSDTYLRNSAHLLVLPTKTEVNQALEIVPFAMLSNDLKKRLAEAATLEPEHSTPARTAWLRKDAREQTLKTYAAKLAHSLMHGETLPLPHTLTIEEILIGIDAIRQASLQKPDIYQDNRHWIETLNNSELSNEQSDAITKLFSHLNTIGLMSDDELRERCIVIPKLAGPFSENLKLIEPFLNEVKQMTKNIEDEPYLSKHLFPVTLIFGSQLKGYGTKNADADVAVFVRPGVDRSEQSNLIDKLSTVFSHEKIGGKAVLFWLDKTETGYTVHDWDQPQNSDGSSSWIHVLFGAAWEGNQDSIIELHHHLLTNYFYDPQTELEEKPTIERWFEEMERDTLQYRLLHKGFERYHSIHSPVNTAHGKEIDGQSAFYDPRYRRIATELFLSRIFLPKLKR